jgi:hypothetical protein
MVEPEEVKKGARWMGWVCTLGGSAAGSFSILMAVMGVDRQPQAAATCLIAAALAFGLMSNAFFRR